MLNECGGAARAFPPLPPMRLLTCVYFRFLFLFALFSMPNDFVFTGTHRRTDHSSRQCCVSAVTPLTHIASIADLRIYLPQLH